MWVRIASVYKGVQVVVFMQYTIQQSSLPVTQENGKPNHAQYDVTAAVMAHDSHALVHTFYIPFPSPITVSIASY